MHVVKSKYAVWQCSNGSSKEYIHVLKRYQSRMYICMNVLTCEYVCIINMLGNLRESGYGKVFHTAVLGHRPLQDP